MLIKSVFVTLYITFVHLSAGFAVFQLVDSGLNWLWFGVLLTSLPGALLFDILLLAKPVARTNNHLIGITSVKLIGLLLVIIFNWRATAWNQESLLISLAGFFGWLAYDYWFSVFSTRDKSKLSVGRILRDLEFLTTQQTPFNTHSLSGSPLLMLFYRGNWCPLCMAQINEIAKEYQQLADLGVKVLLISPQSHQQTEKLASRFDVPFIFLIDKDCQVAKSLGIFAKNGLPLGMQVFGYDSNTVLPTALMTDAHGTIIFADLTDNYRVRPEPSTFLSVLHQHQA